MLRRETLEQHQVWLYLAAVGLGVALAFGPAADWPLSGWMTPLLGLLIFATFTQVPLPELPRALRDPRLAAASLTGNFLLLPVLVWLLSLALPEQPAVLIGFYLVLLVPCTDWFITFTHLGRGNTAGALALTPLLLLVQLAMLPLYLWFFLGEDVSDHLTLAPFLQAFGLLILLPLAAAWLTELGAAHSRLVARWQSGLGTAPVPLLAGVLVLVAADQAPAALAVWDTLGVVALLFVAFLAGSTALALGLARGFGLPSADSRTLIFNLGTRNSFVVLALATALPLELRLAAAVIAIQILVELLGMVLYLRWVPHFRPTWASS